MREVFLKYIVIDSLTGKDIATSIINGKYFMNYLFIIIYLFTNFVYTGLNSCGIDCTNMVGQGYDGASNMAGHVKGTQKIVSENFPKALYVHCAAHSLNLAVSGACDLRSIRNCLGVVEKMYCFFNTPKRKKMLLNEIEESDSNPNSKSLKHLCVTRWVERYTAVQNVVELFPCVVGALDKISEWKDPIATDAHILAKSMGSEFFVSLQVIRVTIIL